jgi:drug/metabolite transporter (DMT)-like permease
MAAVVAASTAFSWGFIIVKALALPPATISTLRLAIGAATLLAVARAVRRPLPVRWRNVLAAGLAFGVHQLLFIEATQRTSVAIVTVIAGLQPLVVAAVSSRTVGERTTRAMAAWAALAVVGVALVVTASADSTSRSLVGDLLAVANLVVFTAYFLYAKRSRQDGLDALSVTAWMLPGALLIVLPALAVTGPAMPTDPVAWLLIAVLALGPGNGHLLVNWAHSRISAALASLALSLVPVLSGVWARLVFGEPFGLLHVVGMLCVVIALQGARRSEQPTRLPAPAAPPALPPGTTVAAGGDDDR